MVFIMKRKINIVLVLFVMAITILSSVNVEAATSNGINQYRRQARKIEKRYKLKAIDSSKLTYKMITNRKNRVILERCIGKVKNKNKDGKVLNTNEGNYISYKGVKCKKGDIIVSYLLWNPENDRNDDVVARWDFVIKK